LFSTFDTESWRPKELGFQSSTFGIESWRPRAKCFWSSFLTPKAEEQKH
jgi:hypothetical protein